MLYQTIRVSAVAVLAAGAMGTAVLAQQGKGRSGAGAVALVIDAQRDRANQALKPDDDPILDSPDGSVTYVDYETNDVTVAVNGRIGARPRMKLIVFDGRSPNVPTQKPKATIELTSVGEKNSRARIIKTANPIDPIRVGDILYALMSSAAEPVKFALLGKIDLNRDGKDDRDELKRMIEQAGGAVEFDLPPPDVGKESGRLLPRIDWYVVDDRQPLRRDPQAKPDTPVDKRFGEVVKEARLNGIRPMTIGKLLAFLGQDTKSPLPGRAEVAQPGAQAKKMPDVEKNARIHQKLTMVTGADFPTTATLGTLLKQIRQMTRDANYPGIPIYVDPAGLAEAKAATEANIVDIPREQPIAVVLRHCLRPLGLAHDVRDGFLMVSSRMEILENRVEEIDRKLDRLIELLDRPQPAK
jgi:hypothetical protein